MSHIQVAVLGSGSWGTALAYHLAQTHRQVHLWARRAEQAAAIAAQGENEAYLPGFALPKNVTATSDLETALHEAELVLSVVPTHGLRGVWNAAVPFLPKSSVVLSCTKGIENASLLLVSQMLEGLLPAAQPTAFLTGPSFAREVAAGMPTAVTVASQDPSTAHRVQHWLRADAFRVYTTEDVLGAELGGALKNVIAIATGISDGLGFGHNARAAIITRGLAEMTRLATRMGGHPMTMAGLAGVGDLVLTCTGDLSRNRRVGLALGKGQTLNDILDGMNMVAEGVRTAKSAADLAQREGVEMPITQSMVEILYHEKDPRSAVAELMSRKARPERDE